MKRTRRPTVILYGACAVIWTVRAVMEIVEQTYRESAFWFILNLLCAALWIGAFIMSLKRYRSDKGRED